ncbi:hypothetical protein SCUP515_01737 [Seiridium cupressi]
MAELPLSNLSPGCAQGSSEDQGDQTRHLNTQQTALHLACGNGHYGIVDVLLKEGADVEVPDADGWTPLMYAADDQPNIDARDHYGNTVLILASCGNNLEVIRALLDGKAGLNLLALGESTALTAACQYSTAEVVLELLKAGADVNAQDNDGDTPVILAARYGNAEMMEYLLRYIPDLHKVRKNRRTALHEVMQNTNLSERYKIVEMLLETGFQVNCRDDNEKTPLHMAVEEAASDIVLELLKTTGIDFNAQDDGHQTPLHLASEAGHPDMVEALLDQTGIDLNVRDLWEQTPLHRAIYRHRAVLAEKLLGMSGIDFNAQDDLYQTALHIASEWGDLRIVEDLLDKPEVQLNIQDYMGVDRVTSGVLAWSCGGKHQNAWFQFVKYLFSSKGRPGLEITSDSGDSCAAEHTSESEINLLTVSQAEIKSILRHADVEELVSAMEFAKSDDHLKSLSAAMETPLAKIKEHKLVRLAKEADAHDEIIIILKENTNFDLLPDTSLHMPDKAAENDRVKAKRIAEEDYAGSPTAETKEPNYRQSDARDFDSQEVPKRDQNAPDNYMDNHGAGANSLSVHKSVEHLDYRGGHERLMDSYKERIIHGSRSLDQFYYSSLKDMVSRDRNQVVTRSFLKRQNGDGVPHKDPKWPYLAVDQLWLWATEEKILFESFKKKMKKKDESEKKKTQDTKEEPELVHTKKETKTEELQTIGKNDGARIDRSSQANSSKEKKQNTEVGRKQETKNWTSISKAADLLDEVKDILDELTILKALVTQQESVWEDLMGQDSEPENARRPIYVLRDIEEMISKCGLEQNGINIDEANESDRLGANVLSQDAVVLPHVTFRLERHGIPA